MRAQRDHLDLESYKHTFVSIATGTDKKMQNATLLAELYAHKYTYNRPSSHCVEGHIFGATVKSLQEEGLSSHLCIVFNAFIYSFSTQLLNDYCTPGTMLGTR